MKSVSFSDLRNDSGMSNFDSNLKRSSSIKQLTYYNSSEDILRKFSTKTSDKFSTKELKKFEEKNEIEPVQKPVEINSEELKSDFQTDSYERTIKELRDQITQKTNIIANLQDENLLLKTESTKNSEQVKYLENRIKYLEHALAAFTGNPEENSEQSNKKNDYFDKENFEKPSIRTAPTAVKTKPLGSRVNFDIESQTDDDGNKNNHYERNRYGNENYQTHEKIADLKKRPTSADSTLQNNYSTLSNPYEYDSYGHPRQLSMKLYDSDSEPNTSNKSHPENSFTNSSKPPSVNFINFQRQKLERDRSMNLSDFKSRLDEFTKYARKSAEQNSLRNSTTSLPQPTDNKVASKYQVTSDKWTDSNPKSRVKSTNHYTRPPIDPYYKQRRPNPYEAKVSNESVTNYSQSSQNEIEEDAILKERVKRILDKHNYPVSNIYCSNTSDSQGKNMGDNIGYREEFSSNSYKRYANNDSIKVADWQNRNSPTHHGVAANARAPYNESSIPRLDLTRSEQSSYFPGDASDLLNKYLNYSGYANVS